MYIQDKVEEYADEVFDLLDKGVSSPSWPMLQCPCHCCASEEPCDTFYEPEEGRVGEDMSVFASLSGSL
jgi:hypothetical protein